MKRLLVLWLAACDAGVPGSQAVSPVAPQPAWPPPSELPAVTANGHTYAIVQVAGIIPELCTNMGGTNWSFTVEGMPSDYQLHGGGHGIFGRGTTLPGMEEAVADDESWRDRYYVADVSIANRGRFEVAVPCSAKRMYAGTVIAVSPARDLAEARAQLAASPRDGLPKAVRIDTFDR